jgi:hypothetical protein
MKPKLLISNNYQEFLMIHLFYYIYFFKIIIFDIFYLPYGFIVKLLLNIEKFFETLCILIHDYPFSPYVADPSPIEFPFNLGNTLSSTYEYFGSILFK